MYLLCQETLSVMLFVVFSSTVSAATFLGLESLEADLYDNSGQAELSVGYGQVDGKLVSVLRNQAGDITTLANVELASVSRDGKTVAGTTLDNQVALWNVETETLRIIDSSLRLVSVEAVSNNGVVVGSLRTDDDAQRAYALSNDGIAIIPLNDGFLSASALDISADGRAIVGITSGSVGRRGFHWTSNGGTVLIGALGDHFDEPNSIATAVSADGTYIVGGSSEQVLFWSQSENRVFGLGGIDGGAIAADVSDDGQTVVGAYLNDAAEADRAMIWTSELGEPVDLADYLTSLGADLQGWQLRRATAISGDGRTIVGNGTPPGGGRRSWIAIVPEPSGFAMMLSAIGILSVFRNRKTCIKSNLTV